jgi:hypothetical protein
MPFAESIGVSDITLYPQFVFKTSDFTYLRLIQEKIAQSDSLSLGNASEDLWKLSMLQDQLAEGRLIRQVCRLRWKFADVFNAYLKNIFPITKGVSVKPLMIANGRICNLNVASARLFAESIASRFCRRELSFVRASQFMLPIS